MIPHEHEHDGDAREAERRPHDLARGEAMPPGRVFLVDEIHALDRGEADEVDQESGGQEQRIGIRDARCRNDVHDERPDTEPANLPPG